MQGACHHEGMGFVLPKRLGKDEKPRLQAEDFACQAGPVNQQGPCPVAAIGKQVADDCLIEQPPRRGQLENILGNTLHFC